MFQTFISDILQVKLFENYYPSNISNNLFESLIKETPWRQDKIVVYGKEYQQPRLTQWYGDNNKSYKYSGILMSPLPWSSVLLSIKNELEKNLKYEFNSVLLNLYRDGNDTVGWHSDDEPELGLKPIIASISLGEEREFLFRSKIDKDNKKSLLLKNGSLLVMFGDNQRLWQHSLPKRKNIKNPRINLTFRTIYLRGTI